MGFLDRVKAALGVGGDRGRVELLAGAIAPGEYCSGKVILEAGQKYNSLDVTLSRKRFVPCVDTGGKPGEREEIEPLVSERLSESADPVSLVCQVSIDFALQVPRDEDVAGRTYELCATTLLSGVVGVTAKATVPLGAAPQHTAASIPALLERARALEAARNTQALVPVLRQILALDAKHAGTLKRLAELLSSAARPDEAAALWKSYTELETTDADGWRGRARAATSRGELAEAVECSRKAAELSPGDAHLWRAHAEALERAARDGDALAAWDRMLEAVEPDWDCHVGRAKLLVKLGRKAEAAEAFRIAAQRDDGDLDDLLEILDGLAHAPLADQLLEEQIAARGETWAVLMLKAERLLRLDRPGEALPALDRLLELEESAQDWAKTRVWRARGKVFELLGRTSEAKAAYATVLEGGVEDRESKQALDRLRA